EPPSNQYFRPEQTACLYGDESTNTRHNSHKAVLYKHPNLDTYPPLSWPHAGASPYSHPLQAFRRVAFPLPLREFSGYPRLDLHRPLIETVDTPPLDTEPLTPPSPRVTPEK